MFSGNVFSCSILSAVLLMVLISPCFLKLMSPMNLLDGSLFFYSLEINMMILMFSCSVCIISATIFFWSRYYMSSSFYISLFYVLFISFVLSMLLLIFSNSLFWLFLGWEGLGVTSFVLIIFYQNWMSTNGGLLTLLTNRVGDGVLMLVLAYFLFSFDASFGTAFSMILSLLYVMLAFTKSAQWPFTSWLPAAMAAPTPVSALVHSSTLVTAGIWILIRFGQESSMNSKLWLMVGFVTLTSASLSAMLESDGKKIVALSTLSQLGLMTMSLTMGGKFLCFFHILSHAFAKANLFMMVGNILHQNYSNQDSRSIGFGGSTFVLFSSLVSVVSLVGLLFSSGYFSKESILVFMWTKTNSILSAVFLVSVISLTMMYCVKLISLFLSNHYLMKAYNVSCSMNSFSTILIMLTMLFGWNLFSNSHLNLLMMKNPMSIVWVWFVLTSMSIYFVYDSFVKGMMVKSLGLKFLITESNFFVKKYFMLAEKMLEGSYFFILQNSYFSLVSKSVSGVLISTILFLSLFLVMSSQNLSLWT